MGAHFFTGFPGFVATQLVRRLFKQEVTKEVYAVVLQAELVNAKAVVKSIESEYEGCQIILFEGDITLPNLDIADEEINVLKSKVEFVWHLAAIHDLTLKREQAWKVNVHGTANVNEFVCKLPNLKRYLFFSSTFISGKRSGKILEMELIRPLAFHNYFEETKFEAELLVDDLKLEVPITIIRPSIIYGHSKTGVTTRFDGIYFLMNLVNYFRGRFMIPTIGSKKTLLHAVAIDFVTKASIALCLNSEAEGETVHLTDSHPYKVMAVYQELVTQMTNRKTFGILPLGIAKVMLEQQSFRQSIHVVPQIVDYLDYEAEFDTKDCEHLLQGTGLAHPDFLQALPNLIAFYEQNKQIQSYHVKIR